MRQLIRNATIVNEGKRFVGSIQILNDRIEAVYTAEDSFIIPEGTVIIEADGLYLFPGVIDDQVHFREPGLTHKGDIFSESKAAVAGGVTSYIEMPNTKPQTTTLSALDEKYAIAAQKSIANYAFMLGATNDNLEELKKADPTRIPAVKMFMGSSTGNMLVDNEKTLNAIFAEVPLMIVTHCEDEAIIQQNIKHYRELLGENIPVQYHPLIRSAEACYTSSAYAVELATRHNSRLHVFHLSTAREMGLFRNDLPLKDKKITAEVCVHHLWFSDADYARYGNRIKWNPAIKTEADRLELINAVNDNRIDVVATDHAPHLLSEKEGSCLQAASGGPLVQHSLVAMLQLSKQGYFTIEKVVEKMCHAPADLFRVVDRGYLRKGYFADMVLVDPTNASTVSPDNILYKCAWSPFEGTTFNATVSKTWVNGKLAYADGRVDETVRGEGLLFANDK